MVLVVSTLFSVVVFSLSSAMETIKIGVVFQNYDTDLLSAFQLSVQSVNDDPSILPNHQIEYIYNYSTAIGAYDSWQKVCYLLGQNVSTIIGPMASTAVKAAHPMCLGLNMPMISPTATDPMLVDPVSYKYLMRIYPPDSKQSRALVDFFKYFRWDTVAILTDNTDYGINGLVDFQTLAAENKWRVLSVQQFVASDNNSLINATEQLRTIRGTGARVILLNCGPTSALSVFEQAHQEGMMQSGWVWVVTDGVAGFNLLPDNLNDRPYLKGIIGTRPTSHNGSLYRNLSAAWSQINGKPLPVRHQAVALAFHDAVMVFAQAMHNMLEVDNIQLSTTPLRCMLPNSQPWNQGNQVYQYLKDVKAEGAMKYLQFSKNGGPSYVSYDYVSLGKSGWHTHGHWVEGYGVELNTTNLASFGDQSLFELKDYGGDLVNRSLAVALVVDPPFVFKLNQTSDGAPCSGNSCFNGYVIDLLERLATDLRFSYDLYEVTTGGYGRQLEDGSWNGMVGELFNQDALGQTKADLGVGAFTISYARQKAIAFTKPYRDHRLGILMGTTKGQIYNAWSFLTPLSNEVWALTVGTAFIVGFVITLLDKLSPYGHHGKKGQIDNQLEHEAMDVNDDGTIDYWEMKEWRAEKHTMNFHNALLWALASLFEQGAERHPKSWSARIAAGAWWIGALIIIQSYTANLAAFLTIKTQSVDIESLEDLVNQVDNRVQYGTVRDSNVHDFLVSSNREPYSHLVTKINDWDTYFDSTEEIVQYTNDKEGTFAFLYDMPVLDYWKGQAADCGLTVLPNGFANFGFGFGLPMDSIYLEELTLNIYTLREEGFMDTLDEKWLYQTAQCADSSSEPSINEDTNVRIGMPSLWGAFWAVYIGFGVSFILMIVEWFVSALSSYDKSDENRPQTPLAGLRHRYIMLKRDVLENWFPVNFNKTEVKRRESSIRPLPPNLQMKLLKAAATAAMLSSKLKKEAPQDKEDGSSPNGMKNGTA